MGFFLICSSQNLMVCIGRTFLSEFRTKKAASFLHLDSSEHAWAQSFRPVGQGLFFCLFFGDPELKLQQLRSGMS